MPDVRPPRLPVRADGAGPFTGLPLTPGEDLVAAGGRLSADLVLHAYRHGVFPWYSADEPPLWWCPDPRAVLPLSSMHVPRRLARTLASQRFRLTADTSFDAVIRGCAREGDTWIHPAMIRSYGALHGRGHARSFEVWQGAVLVGGLYGVSVPPVFCAESKFHTVRDASKVAFVHACRTLASEGFTHMEVQFLTPHLAQFGVVETPRSAYLELLTSSAGARRR
jgi:leucyl/phenylalanyl-tRNA---protein transferase